MTLATFVFAIAIQAVAFTNVAQGTSSQIDESRKVVVRNASDWLSLWKSHSTAALPKVDFSKSIVAGVFLGMRPTAGYTVQVLRVTRTGTTATIEYVEGKPDPSRMVAQMLTSPFHLIAIPADIQTVEFKQVAK